MKKILFVVLVSALFCSIIFAKSSSGKTSKKTEDGFIETYDMVSDITTIRHTDLEIKSFYNLKDSISGERENISLYIANKILVVSANYQFSKWLFIEKIILIDSNNNRLELTDGKRNEEVVTGKIVRESYYVPLSIKEVEKLETILKNGAKICFVGSQSRTDIYEIKDKVTAPMLATIEKWRSLQ